MPKYEKLRYGQGKCLKSKTMEFTLCCTNIILLMIFFIILEISKTLRKIDVSFPKGTINNFRHEFHYGDSEIVYDNKGDSYIKIKIVKFPDNA